LSPIFDNTLERVIYYRIQRKTYISYTVRGENIKYKDYMLDIIENAKSL